MLSFSLDHGIHQDNTPRTQRRRREKQRRRWRREKIKQLDPDLLSSSSEESDLEDPHRPRISPPESEKRPARSQRVLEDSSNMAPRTRNGDKLDDANKEIALLKAKLAQATKLAEANKPAEANAGATRAAGHSDMTSVGEAPSQPRASLKLNPTKAKRNSKRKAPARDDEDDSAFVRDAIEGKARKKNSADGMKKSSKRKSTAFGEF